jgi:hypothetical protein
MLLISSNDHRFLKAVELWDNSQIYTIKIRRIVNIDFSRVPRLVKLGIQRCKLFGKTLMMQSKGRNSDIDT